MYIAGGPNGIGQPSRPDLWVYSPPGDLLAALRAPGENVFLNDVAIGPDGGAYFTNSNAPQVFRVALGAAGWRAQLWADATGTVATQPGFNLGGIVTSRTARRSWSARERPASCGASTSSTPSVTQVSTGGADLTGADGLVRQGTQLTVIRNFQRMLATLRLSADGSAASLVDSVPTDPTRVLTTAKILRRADAPGGQQVR